MGCNFNWPAALRPWPKKKNLIETRLWPGFNRRSFSIKEHNGPTTTAETHWNNNFPFKKRMNIFVVRAGGTDDNAKGSAYFITHQIWDGIMHFFLFSWQKGEKLKLTDGAMGRCARQWHTARPPAYAKRWTYELQHFHSSIIGYWGEKFVYGISASKLIIG